MQRLRFNSDLWLGPTGGTSYVSFGNISIGGHLGGLVGGILVMAGLWRFGRGGRHADLASAGVLLGVAALSVLIAYFKVRGLA